jgi:drug/metabolite transporter (DMT)-like permease
MDGKLDGVCCRNDACGIDVCQRRASYSGSAAASPHSSCGRNPCFCFVIAVGVSDSQRVRRFYFGDTFLFKSFEYNSARISMLIMAFAPAATAIFAYFFLGELFSFMGLLGMLVTLTGIALVVLEQPEHASHHMPISWLGIFYAFLGAVGQAGGLILARCAFDRGPVNGILATFIRVVAATVVIVPLNYFTGRFLHPIQVFKQDKRALWYTFLGCIFGPVVGVSFSLISISLTNVAIAATLMATTPVMMLLPVRLIYKEHLTWRIIVGTIIAVGGVGILFLR